MNRRALPVVLSLLLLPVGMAHAAFHFAHIAELNANGGGDPTEQYVEIRMETVLQTFTTNSVLAAWSCDGTFLGDLLVVPGNIATGGAGARWIMATKNPVGGITPDFVIPSAGIPTDCGQVCWGAPDDTFLPPSDPNSWDHTNPANFVDCVAYGPYTGPTRPGSGSPSPLTPGDGTYSLVRIDDMTLAADCPSPENNAVVVGGYGPCTDPTTTTTTTSTTTTLPAGGADLLPGRKLLLKVKEGDPDRSGLLVFSQKDASTTLGRGEGTLDDPTQNGGRVLVWSSPGGGFVDVYPLASSGWNARRKNGAVTGWGFKSSEGPITSVSIKGGKSIIVKGKGAGLGHDMDDDPNPVSVVLAIGEHRYCLSFGGKPKFKAGKKYLAEKAPAPSVCADLPD